MAKAKSGAGTADAVVMHAKSARRLLSQHKWALALAEFETVERLRGDEQEYLLGQAECHLRLKAYEAAGDCCDRLLRTRPGCALAHRILGCVAEETKDYARAKYHYLEAKERGDELGEAMAGRLN